MKFKPLTEKYNFDDKVLFKDFPEHIQTPIATLLKDILKDAKVWRTESDMMSYREWINADFLNSLDLNFREKFPREHEDFLPFVLGDVDRTSNFIALVLQNYARPTHACKMEIILATGGSGYAVLITAKDPSTYDKGIANLVERVPEIVETASVSVIKSEDLIKEAWLSCYSRNPDYAKTVSKCVDALEGLFKNQYFPKDMNPALGKFVKDFTSNPNKLSFKGDSIIDPKNTLTELAKEFIPIRGHHTSGTGRNPTKEEAEFVLHYSVFVFSLHQ